MPSYVITGVSQGLGAEFLRHLSANPNNTVIGLVRDKATTDKKVAAELGNRSNVHILRADLTSHADLKQAAADTASITGGSVDYLIANAAYVTGFDAFDGIDTLAEKKSKELSEDFHRLLDVNVIGNVYFFNAFMPLILKGTGKKVLCITSGMADLGLTREVDLKQGALYGASKAAMNVMTAKYAAQYKEDGVTFVGVCPGTVDTGKSMDGLSQEQMQSMGELFGKFQKYQPAFKGQDPLDVAIPGVLKIFDNATLADSGAFLSHTGTDKWL
ncbi:putative short chain dehydrogenase [Xylariaceae sp. AK1471]|nr:putative short chain dehydrogenase [Xylariaceae sp. AK1471]